MKVNHFQNKLKVLSNKIKSRMGSARQAPLSIATIFKYLGISVLAGLFLLVIYCSLIRLGTFGKLPSYTQLKSIENNTASEVYAEDGVLLGKYYIQNRVNASMGEISPNVVNALVATEDARFFKHKGVDIKAWGRVFFKTLLMSNESSGGGSTLSQQLTKNLFPRKSYRFLSTPTNKIREMFVAKRLEKLYTKEELLKLYLNTVPFSENIFGIKVAAKRFFDKTPEQLNIEEAAILVGMLKATTTYNPLRHPEKSLERRNTVLTQLHKYEYITTLEKDSLMELPLNLDYHSEGHNEGLATYFREHLRLEVENLIKEYKKEDRTTYNLYTDGLKIHTTINADMQTYAEQAVLEHLAKLQADFYKDWKTGTPWGSSKVLKAAKQKSKRYKALKAKGVSEEEIDEIFNTPIRMKVYNRKKEEQIKEMSPLDSIKHYLTVLNTGFLAMEPQTGDIKAWVGGVDHEFFQYDHVKSRRQVGSTFKPVVYASALQHGYVPCEYTHNRLTTYTEFDDWQPRNSNGKYGGVYSMEGALTHSVNSVTVETLLKTGVNNVRELAKNMGIKQYIDEVPAIALGAVDASVLDMVTVYGTLVNRGLRPEPRYIERIETRDGEVLYERKASKEEILERALEEHHADMMVQMLKSVVDSGTARKLRYQYNLRTEMAGKTGTTQNQTDGWFIGFTPNLVAGVWVGAENPAVHFKSMRYGQGSSSALPIWGRFMKKLIANDELYPYAAGRFPTPPDSLLHLMDCPSFLEEMPTMVELDEFDENPIFLEDYSDKIDMARILTKMPQRKPNESEQRYAQRVKKFIDKQVKKEERRIKRKEFWSERLFKKREE